MYIFICFCHWLRGYPDLPQLSNQITENGLIGSREEREALVPSRAGQIELPAVEVVWWNTHEDHLERSYLPAHTLQVAANPNLAVDTPANDMSIALGEASSLWLWQLSTLLLACTTLARLRPMVAGTLAAGHFARRANRSQPAHFARRPQACLSGQRPQSRARHWTPWAANNQKPSPTWPPVLYCCPTPWTA